MYFFINPVRRSYWFIVRPETRGVKCVLIWQKKILLVKLLYAHKKWSIPGGGVGRHESLEDAIKREIKEEVGIDLETLVCIGMYKNTKEYKKDTVTCFVSYVTDPYVVVDNIEIGQAEWFDLDKLPALRTQSIEKILDLYRKVAGPNG